MLDQWSQKLIGIGACSTWYGGGGGGGGGAQGSNVTGA